MQVVFALETLPLSVLSCPSGVAAANFSLVLLAPAAWRSAQQVSFERFSSLWWLLKRCRESQPSSKMVLHRFSLACYALIVLRRLLCSLHVRSRCHWTSVVTEPFRCQFLYRVRVPSVPASRSFVSLHHSLLVCACARLLSPLMISDLCSGQTHHVYTDKELDTCSGHGFGGLPPICPSYPRRFRPCRPAP